jgi:hypothetical protein
MSVVPKASVIGDERGLIKAVIYPEKMVSFTHCTCVPNAQLFYKDVSKLSCCTE